VRYIARTARRQGQLIAHFSLGAKCRSRLTPSSSKTAKRHDPSQILSGKGGIRNVRHLIGPWQPTVGSSIFGPHGLTRRVGRPVTEHTDKLASFLALQRRAPNVPRGKGGRHSLIANATLGTSRVASRSRPSLNPPRGSTFSESIHRIYHDRHILFYLINLLLPTPRKRRFPHLISFDGELTSDLCIHFDGVFIHRLGVI
jgi:hypothetical protein